MKTLQHRTRSAAKRAFTLIEIMVATVIMVVLVGLVIQITSEVLKVWTRSSGKLAANAEARIAMDLITQDLETAVFRNNGQQWLRVQGPETTGGKFDDDTVSLKLFSPALDRPQQYTSSDTILQGRMSGMISLVTSVRSVTVFNTKNHMQGETLSMCCIVWWRIRSRLLSII